MPSPPEAVPRYPIPDGPHNDEWKQLLPHFFPVADEVTRRRGTPFPIQIGGGSMLLRRYGHRRSRDLDLFVTDVQLARMCSPRFNDAAEDLFPDYGEDATAVRLIFGMQEIDIIAVAPVILEDATEPAVLSGRQVLVERPREILAKKVVYRGRGFQPRDVFDLACVLVAEPDEVAAILPWINITHVMDLEARLGELAPVLRNELAEKVNPYEDFESIRDNCLDIVKVVVEEWKAQLTPKVIIPPYPSEGHRPLMSRDSTTVVIKEFNPASGRFDRISNPLGPAKVGPEGSAHILHGVEMTEEEWRQHPEVVSALTAQASPADDPEAPSP